MADRDRPPADPPSRSIPRPAVGSDVVDLTDPRCRGKGSSDRFLQRVLTGAEREVVRAADDPDLALWRRWAAKEAAFKAATILTGTVPTFVHAEFEVEEESSDRGVVRWRGRELPWRGTGGRRGGGLHVVAWSEEERGRPFVTGGTAFLPAEAAIPAGRFSEAELEAVHSPASAWVRLRARAALSRAAELDEGELEIVCAPGPVGRAPPRVLVRGEPSEWTVSLSHHGRLLGWSLARWPRGTRPDPPTIVAPPLPEAPPGQMPGGR